MTEGRDADGKVRRREEPSRRHRWRGEGDGRFDGSQRLEEMTDVAVRRFGRGGSGRFETMRAFVVDDKSRLTDLIVYRVVEERGNRERHAPGDDQEREQRSEAVAPKRAEH